MEDMVCATDSGPGGAVLWFISVCMQADEIINGWSRTLGWWRKQLAAADSVSGGRDIPGDL